MLWLLAGLIAALAPLLQRAWLLRRLAVQLSRAASLGFAALLVSACQCNPPGEDGGERARSNEPRAITEVPEGAVFYLGDHQHSPVVLTNARGELVRSAAYHPYGPVRHTNGDQSDPYAYVGNEHDRGAGLADFQARPYRPESGVFLAPDPVAVFEPEKLLEQPSRLGAYTYAGGNPTDRSDRGGEFWDTVLDVAFIGYDVGTIVAENVVGRTTEKLKQNLVALALDVGCAALPFATGAGIAYRATRTAPKVAGAAEKSLYRSMSHAEAGAVRETGLLRGGVPGEAYWTDSPIRSASRAQDRLSLAHRPEVQMEFRITNNPELQRAGTRVGPKHDGRGGGREYMSVDPVEVEVINVQPYAR